MSTRTTLTLDDDVAAELKRAARKSGRSFRALVNESLRVGLRSSASASAMPPFKVMARPMGLREGFDLDDIEGLLDLLDGPTRP